MSTQYAFPLADPDGPMQQGMTLRDSKALQSLDQSGYAYPKGMEAMAHDACQMAAAMLKAREEVKP